MKEQNETNETNKKASVSNQQTMKIEIPLTLNYVVGAHKNPVRSQSRLICVESSPRAGCAVVKKQELGDVSAAPA